MRIRRSQVCGGLASVMMGWAMLSAPVLAGTFGVSLSASGGAGDACQLTPQIDAEGFNSGSLTGSSYLNYSGSAVGYDNSYPDPGNPSLNGCAYSPVFANIAANGTAQLGLLEASASADMTTIGLVGAGASATVGWNDTFTAVTGGTFEMIVSLDADVSATPSCPSGNNLAHVNYNFNEYGPFNQQDIADWTETDCNTGAGPTYLYGSTTELSSSTVELFEGLSAGQSFTVNASLTASAGAGLNQSSDADASDTATLSVIGLNGATYSSASGVTYDFSEAPEPSSWLLSGGGLALLGWRFRRRFEAKISLRSSKRG